LDQTVKLWDVQTGREILTLRDHRGAVRTVAFSPDGHRLVSSSGDRTVRVWDATPTAGEPDPGCLTLRGHTADVNIVAFHPRDPGVLASGGADSTVRVWDAHNGIQLQILSAHAPMVEALAFSPDGGRFAWAAHDRTVRVWATTTWQEIPHSPLSTQGDVRSLEFGPDGRLLAAGCYAKHPLTIWEAASGKLLRELPNNWVITSLAFSPEGKRLAAANSDATVRIWDVGTGVEIVSPPLKHGGGVNSVAFSPDGRRLASGSMDRTVRVWDTASWKRVFWYSEPGAVKSVAFSPDGQRLAWGSTDAPVKVFDEATDELHTLRGHTSGVHSVAFSPDGRRLASASADGTVKVWEAPPVVQQPRSSSR
jgi:WD40 repeat protein